MDDHRCDYQDEFGGRSFTATVPAYRDLRMEDALNQWVMGHDGTLQLTRSDEQFLNLT